VVAYSGVPHRALRVLWPLGTRVANPKSEIYNAQGGVRDKGGASQK
jgi:hypothetical protein